VITGLDIRSRTGRPRAQDDLERDERESGNVSSGIGHGSIIRTIQADAFHERRTLLEVAQKIRFRDFGLLQVLRNISGQVCMDLDQPQTT
jgi:hypothetical protein